MDNLDQILAEHAAFRQEMTARHIAMDVQAAYADRRIADTSQGIVRNIFRRSQRQAERRLIRAANELIAGGTP